MAHSFPLLSIFLVAASACANQATTNVAPASPTGATAANTPAEQSAESNPDWWTSKAPCPDGAALDGAAPPAGSGVACLLASVPHGPKTTFHKNGQRDRSEVYYRGKLHGRFTVHYESGTLAEEGRYANGELEGRSVRYHESGAEHV